MTLCPGRPVSYTTRPYLARPICCSVAEMDARQARHDLAANCTNRDAYGPKELDAEWEFPRRLRDLRVPLFCARPRLVVDRADVLASGGRLGPGQIVNDMLRVAQLHFLEWLEDLAHEEGVGGA